MWRVVFADGLVACDGLGGGAEVVAACADVEDFFWQGIEELEDAGFFPLVLAEGFVIHEEVAEVAGVIDAIDPLGERVGVERPMGPAAIGEAEGDVIAEAIVFQQQLDGRLSGIGC